LAVLRQELASIDAVLARRPALNKPTRRENIEHAIWTAGNATDEAIRLRAELAAQTRKTELFHRHTKELLEQLQQVDDAKAADTLAKLADPSVVHLNMLRGDIAKPDVGLILHLYPELLESVRKRAAERLSWSVYKEAEEAYHYASDFNMDECKAWSGVIIAAVFPEDLAVECVAVPATTETTLWARCSACLWVGKNTELPPSDTHPCGEDKCPSCGVEGCITCCYPSEVDAENGEFPATTATKHPELVSDSGPKTSSDIRQ
jgi:hypothetical protein